jgi:excinuclease UvrABC ATPase subunit
VDLPKGVLTVIAGVAGSGKSSLMECFCEKYPESIYISQKNIGISLRSTPATYLGIADEIRKIYAKRSGVKASLFSFNGKGKCPVCGGKGVIVSDMAFMDAIETTCEACGGLRYSKEALAYEVDGMNIAQVMDLSVEKAVEWFAGTAIAEMLQPLLEVGLSYIHLNQSLSTLSGGELQRMKLASYLKYKGEVFVLDEPTDGLHMEDILNILNLFHKMVDQGNTIYLIEHNLDVLKQADYVVELGPGGGDEGGKVLYEGTPEGMLACKQSVTAPYLRGESDA